MDWNTSIYFGVNGEITGPITLREFRRAIDDRRVPSGALVCFRSDEGWLSVKPALDQIAADFPAFWEDPKQPPPIPAAPTLSEKPLELHEFQAFAISQEAFNETWNSLKPENPP